MSGEFRSQLNPVVVRAAELLSWWFRKRSPENGGLHLLLGGEGVDLAPLRAIVGSELLHVPDYAVHGDWRKNADGIRIGSLVVLSGLELFKPLSEFLGFIGKAARSQNAPVVLSVGNSARLEYGLQIALGNVQHLNESDQRSYFDHERLEQELHAVCLRVAKSGDIVNAGIDNITSGCLPGLSSSTEIGEVLTRLFLQANPHCTTDIFVRLCEYDDRSQEPDPNALIAAPFLSIIVRTQGRRPHTLVETMLSLTSQSNLDFEVIVLGHKLTELETRQTKSLIEEFPEWFRHKVRYLAVQDGGRARPLNEGFASALGEYVCFLDDDDVVFSHYVQTFFAMRQNGPGRVLRSVAVTQDCENVQVADETGLISTGGLERRYMPEFDLFVHLRFNQSPFMTLAFPREAYQPLGFRFDETLTTTEDWDFLLRVAGMLGVVSSPAITAIYRWWHVSESSRTVHKQDEWDRNRVSVYEKTDRTTLLFPRGTSQRIRYLLNAYDATHKLRAANYPLAQRTAEAILSLYKEKLRISKRNVLSRSFKSSREQDDVTDADLVNASRLFDAAWYLDRNMDVRNAKVDPLTHFLASGGREGRAASPDFDSQRYLNLNPDVLEAGLNPLVHYVRWGIFEGRPVR